MLKGGRINGMTAQPLIDYLQQWYIDAGILRSARPWCVFEVEQPFNRENIFKYFDVTDLAKKYSERFVTTDQLQKKPHAYLQTEINIIYGFRKAFVCRHKTRLQLYRDDASQKAYHCQRAIIAAFTKFNVAKDAAEQ